MIPTALPTHAPMVREGRKIPAGKAAPNVTAVRRVLAKAVTRSRMTVGVELDGLTKA